MTKLLNHLNDFDLVSVQGHDSLKFLQGQLTCNIDRVTPTQSLAGAYCNLKGRVITDFRIFLRDDIYYLQTQKGLGEVLQKTLDKYIVFSKAKTKSVSQEFRRAGLSGDGSSALLQSMFGSQPEQDGECLQTDELTIIKLKGPLLRYEIFYKDVDSAAMNHLSSESEQAGPTHWQLADIEAGIVHISPAMQEMYTPQVLNYDICGLVDFKKGCYTGQEIVARMHYRAHAKKRLYHLMAGVGQADTLVLTLAGVENPAEIITFCTRNDTTHLLAILPCDELADEPALTLTAQHTSSIEQVAALLVPL
jgi:tRNA-modifying protein YgfZ